ncbi:MAG: hypothetical protein IJD92_05255 [Bacilli bacterium]|nr:hypothetical protein [Bacilli bacterium]
MTLDKLRYSLTDHQESFSLISDYVNFMLLIHPSINKYDDLLNRIEDDINLLPEIESTIDKTDIKFYRYGYKEEIYSKSELLAFIFASINQDWNIIKGLDTKTGRFHFWLKNKDVVFDPSLAVLTNEDIYKKRYKKIKEIKNNNIKEYLIEHNNLYKFYQKEIFKKRHSKDDKNFSINFINEIINKFNENINRQYILNDERIKHLKKVLYHDDFIEFRQVLTKKRVSYLQSENIAVHHSIDESVLEIIKKGAKNICELMKNEYDMIVDYFNRTIGNCYALSIMFNLYNGDFKLIQGYIPYEEERIGGKVKCRYQHSWLEKDNFVYDPAFRLITPKELYYQIVQKEDEYSKEETENILRRIGFNLTHFKDFMNGETIGNDERVRYKSLVNEIDSQKFKEEGEELISLVRKIKNK